MFPALPCSKNLTFRRLKEEGCNVESNNTRSQPFLLKEITLEPVFLQRQSRYSGLSGIRDIPRKQTFSDGMWTALAFIVMCTELTSKSAFRGRSVAQGSFHYITHECSLKSHNKTTEMSRDKRMVSFGSSLLPMTSCSGFMYVDVK